MSLKRVIQIALPVVIGAAVLVAFSLALTPQNSAAFEMALRFADAAGKGDDQTATALLSPALQEYVSTHCPDGSVSACISGYTPAEWGAFQSVVFRRAGPDGEHWNVQLIATYQYAEGFSGVCIFVRMEALPHDAWQVAGWAGYVSCGDPTSRDMAINPDTPNRAP